MVGQDFLRFIPERHRQTVRTHLADVRDGMSEPLIGFGSRPDGSEIELEVRATMLDLHGERFFVRSVRDVTERQRQARQAAAPGPAAPPRAAGGSLAAGLHPPPPAAPAPERR